MKPCQGQLSMFSAEASRDHASLFLSPGTEEARKMTVTSGRKCYELYGKSLPLGSLVKTCLESSIWHSTRCFLTWKTQDTPRKRLLFRLAVSMPRTKETGSVFWPTPSTGAALCGGTGNFKTLQAMEHKGLITEEERRQLSQGNGGKTNPGLLEWLMGYEQKFTELIPTPMTRDWKTAPAYRYFQPGGVQELPARVSGMHAPWENWPGESGILRVVDGLPHRVDRIKCLGNAVVPQQFYIFFKLIADIENGA